MPRAPGEPGIVGVNIGANKDSADRIGDYELGVKRFAPLCHLSHRQHLLAQHAGPARHAGARTAWPSCLSRVMAARDAEAGGRRKPPIFLKIAPDLDEAELEDIAAEVLEKAIDGVIVSNTTISRPPLRSARTRDETGGLSGKPLFERSTIVLAKMRRLLGPDVAIIGVGGVDFGRDGAGKDPRRRRPRAALHRHDLWRAGAAGAHRCAAWPRFAEPEGLEVHSRAARQPPRPLGGQAAQLKRRPQRAAADDRQQAEAARDQEHVQRRPQAVIAEGSAPSVSSAATKTSERQQHHVAHVARPGRADEDAVHLEGQHAAQRGERRPGQIDRRPPPARPRRW